MVTINQGFEEQKIMAEKEETRGVKRALVVLLFGIGFLVMVIGLVTDFYDFIPEGLLGWLAAWILAFVLLAFFGPIAPKEE
jgi:hypothetical protein